MYAAMYRFGMYRKPIHVSSHVSFEPCIVRAMYRSNYYVSENRYSIGRRIHVCHHVSDLGKYFAGKAKTLFCRQSGERSGSCIGKPIHVCHSVPIRHVSVHHVSVLSCMENRYMHLGMYQFGMYRETGTCIWACIYRDVSVCYVSKSDTYMSGCIENRYMYGTMYRKKRYMV